MLKSLDDSTFFFNELHSSLSGLGLGKYSPRLTMAALMLAPLLELSTEDRVTSPSEFEAVEDFLRKLEEDFELATRDEIESVGTDMGLLPMLPGSWDRDQFKAARQTMVTLLEKLPSSEAHEVRSAIAAGCLAVARAGGGAIINLHRVSDDEKPLIAEIVSSLQLDATAEGLHLLERAGLR
jgi:hypothetical protein